VKANYNYTIEHISVQYSNCSMPMTFGRQCKCETNRLLLNFFTNSGE